MATEGSSGFSAPRGAWVFLNYGWRASGTGTIWFVQPNRAPDPLARTLGHLFVGGLLYLVLRGRSGTANSLVIAAVGMGVHHLLDEPVADALSELGV